MYESMNKYDLQINQQQYKQSKLVKKLLEREHVKTNKYNPEGCFVNG